MTSMADIAQVILLMQAAFPNYHPELATAEALYQFLQDLPGETLKAAVVSACAQPGRAFAPSVGEIRQAALNHSARADGIPSEFEAWEELCRMPGSQQRKTVMLDESGNPLTDERGAVLIRVERLEWSHPLVEQAARLMGWPDFPGEDAGLDRAHFYQAYRSLLSRRVEEQGELPMVKKYLEDLRRERGGSGPQDLKKLMNGLSDETHSERKDKK